MPSKFLNISTDTTLGGSSASDDTVSSQKAIKAYVDSQTGTAPAFANITGQPTDNANLATALNAKYDASNPNGYTSNVGTVTSVNNVSPVSGNVTLSIPTVTDTYSATSSNAMSGKAVASALSSYVPTSRTINSKALSSNITLSASDVGAVATNTTITGSTKCKITYDSKGLVTGGADLSASDIPDLSSTYQTKLSSSNKLSTDYISGLATVATSGKSSDLNNDAGFITGITSGDVTTALGYTPYNSTNPSGYITGITSSDVTTALGYTPYNSSNPSGYQANVIETVKVNGTALTPSSKAVDVTVPTETTVSGWGFTKNAGTVTSVNNVSPVSGNVTLSIPTVTDTYSATSSNAMSGKAVASAISGKQDTLVSGTSIKTVNSTSLLGSGNIAVQSVIDANNKLDYAYLSNTPTIPTVNNATLTITQGGTTKGTFTANASSNVTIDLDSGGSEGSVRNIGEIVQSTVPLSDAGLHLLDGGVISGSGSYSAFVTYVAGLVSGHSELFTTESDWQTSVTNYGVCGKFVYDSQNNTVRLPKYGSQIISSLPQDITVKGNGKTLGLTDGTNNYGLSNPPYGSANALGFSTDFYDKDVGTTLSAATIANIGKTLGVTTDGSKSGIIANTSDIPTEDCYYYIVIATSTKTQIEVDIDEVMTDLNGKVDIADLATCHVVVETYVNGTSWYRVYSDRWCEQGGYNSSDSASITFLKPYANTNYTVTATILTTTPSTSYYATKISSKTASGFTMTGNSIGSMWEAKGYIS